MKKTLYLIRHGQTQYNQEGRYYGRLDTPLNDAGRAQMAALRERVSGIDFDQLYSSSMLRAKQSAAILFPYKQVTSFDQLREIDFGKWEGLFYDEIIARYSEDYQAWLSDPYKYPPTEGESMNRMQDRITPALDKIISTDHSKTIAIVSHAGTTRIIYRYLIGPESSSFWDIPIDNSHYWKFVLEEGKVVSHDYE